FYSNMTILLGKTKFTFRFIDHLAAALMLNFRRKGLYVNLSGFGSDGALYRAALYTYGTKASDSILDCGSP
ncbi:MAG: hypothetical protein ACE5G1_09585, partial [bacterium]